MARAMWKGSIKLGKQRLGVKMYSAVEDRSVSFRMLHKKDQAPVEQHIIRKDSGEDVEREDIRKAFSISNDTAVILQPEDLEKLIPADSRDIELARFVTPGAMDNQWYDRPYYLGPEENAESYFALSQALEDTKLIGIARWVMRKKQYFGALTSLDGYLALTTMRRPEQILKFSGVETAADAKPLPNELKLAEQLVSAILADFDPHLWRNEYRARLLEVIQAKARGTKLPTVRATKKAPSVSLAESLKASIAAVRDKKVA